MIRMNVLPLIVVSNLVFNGSHSLCRAKFVIYFALSAYFVLTVPFLSMRHDEVACMDVMYNP